MISGPWPIVGVVVFLLGVTCLIGWALRKHNRMYPLDRELLGRGPQRSRRFRPDLFTWLSGGHG